MVIIRLSRSGSKKHPFYRVVAINSGRFNERLGFYNPMIAEGPQRLTFNAERIQHWVNNGAQMSDTVARILKAAQKAVA